MRSFILLNIIKSYYSDKFKENDRILRQVACMEQDRNAYKAFVRKAKERKHLENEAQACSTHTLWVTCCLINLCYVACRDISDETMSFNTSLGTVKVECSSNFEKLSAVYLWRNNTLLIYFVKLF
jgi:hypothetical protein